MNSTAGSEKIKRLLNLNIPAIGVLLILAFIALLETPILDSLRTETMFAWILIFFAPLAVLLGLIQLYIWFRVMSGQTSPQFKKAIQIVFLAALTVFAGFLLLRWTL